MASNPTFSSAVVEADGKTVSLAFTIPAGGTPPLTLGGNPTQANDGGFVVTAAGAPVSVSSASAATNIVTLKLSAPVLSGQAVTVAYTSGGNGDVQDSAGTPNTLATFAAQNASNNLPLASGYAVMPSSASGSKITNGSAVSLPITLTGGSGLSSALGLTATLAAGLAGAFASTTSGVTVTGTGPYVITVPSGAYASGINLSFTPDALATNGTLTLTHTGGGAGFASGGDPGPFTYTVINTLALCPGPIEYTDPATGQLTVVPIGALTFDLNGNLVVAAHYSAIKTPWLDYLVSAKVIQPAPAAG